MLVSCYFTQFWRHAHRHAATLSSHPTLSLTTQSSNALTSLSNETFAGLTSLTILDLVRDAPRPALAHPSCVTRPHAPHVSTDVCLAHILSTTFLTMQNYNLLTRLPDGIFAGLTNLARLGLVRVAPRPAPTLQRRTARRYSHPAVPHSRLPQSLPQPPLARAAPQRAHTHF